jgi:hypothetical protein
MHMVSEPNVGPRDAECPPWCERDHCDDPPLMPRSHIGCSASVRLADAGGDLGVYLYRRGEPGPEVIVARGYVHGDHPFEGRWHCVPLADDRAAGLADLIELLGTATRGEHRAVADAIRRAAAVITPAAEPGLDLAPQAD